MANSKISVTPQTLRDQAEKMKNISEQLYSINSTATAVMDKIDSSFFTVYSTTLRSKCQKVLKNIGTVRESMELGNKVASECAESYENTDKVIRDMIGDLLPEEVASTPVSEQKVLTKLQKKIEEMKETSTFKPGASWGSNASAPNGKWGGVSGMNSSGCCAMSAIMQIEAYGITSGSWTGNKKEEAIQEKVSSNIKDVQAGDRIHYRYKYKGEIKEHWVFVIGVNKDEAGNVISVSVGEGNAWNGKTGKDYMDEVVNYRELPTSDIIKGTEEIYRIKDKYIPDDMK